MRPRTLLIDRSMLVMAETGVVLDVVSEQSVDSIDSTSLIIDSPELWRELQVKLKESGNVTGHQANTKEVLRKFVAKRDWKAHKRTQRTW